MIAISKQWEMRHALLSKKEIEKWKKRKLIYNKTEILKLDFIYDKIMYKSMFY